VGKGQLNVRGQGYETYKSVIYERAKQAKSFQPSPMFASKTKDSVLVLPARRGPGTVCQGNILKAVKSSSRNDLWLDFNPSLRSELK
jgi:hypothetical protein